MITQRNLSVNFKKDMLWEMSKNIGDGFHKPSRRKNIWENLKEAKQLLEAIGGKENVNAVTHCATRMRFVLADEKKQT